MAIVFLDKKSDIYKSNYSKMIRRGRFLKKLRYSVCGGITRAFYELTFR